MKKMMFFLFTTMFLTACVSQPLKAPCDEHANFCGTKTKINQW